jgi:hypothetical protein
MRKHGARNLQTMKRVSLAILSLVQSYYDNWNLKRVRFTLSLGFEEHIEAIFKLLNAQAIRNLLLPEPTDFYAFILENRKKKQKIVKIEPLKRENRKK